MACDAKKEEEWKATAQMHIYSYFCDSSTNQRRGSCGMAPRLKILSPKLATHADHETYAVGVGPLREEAV